jgi:hypothetical protein
MSTRLIILFVLFMGLTGCASVELRWRHDAGLLHDRLRLIGADKLLPDEFRSLEETLSKGAACLQEGDEEASEKFYRLALTKGLLFERNVAMERERRTEAARLKAAAEQSELKRQMAIREEQLRLAEEKSRVEADAAAGAAVRDKAGKPQPVRERQLAVYHTVKRRETLPQIAAQSDVYNDHTLWPLLYRANRDQISDPRQIWPGQALRIPRNASRYDIVEARRYAQEHPLH